MAIVGTAIADGGIANAANGAVTGTITFNTGKFYVFGVGGDAGFGTSVSISGLGLTWAKYVTENNDTIIWYGTGTPSSGVITFTKTGTHSLIWCADEFTNVKGSGPFRQEIAAFNSGATCTATLGSALVAGNAVYGFIRRQTAAQAEPTPRGGQTELGFDSVVFTGESGYSVDGTNNASWSNLSAGANAWLGIAIEMAQGTSAGGGGGQGGGRGGGRGGGGGGGGGVGGGGGGNLTNKLMGNRRRKRLGVI